VEKSKTRPGSKCPSRGRRYSPAEKAAILETAKAKGVPEAARARGVADWTVYRWIDQEKRAALRAVAPAVKVNAQSERKATLSPEQEERHRLILETWRQQPGLGPTQIKNQLRRHGLKASVHVVRRVMEEHGYVQPRVERKEHSGSYEAVRPRQLYHLDFLHFYVHKQRQCLLLIEDDFSRFVTGWALLESEQADGVIRTYEESVLRYGRPEAVMSDRGAAFFSFKGVSRFDRILAEDDVEHFVATEAPVNGKVEALNAAVRKELLTQVEFADLTDARARIASWVHTYNYRRTHTALGGLLVPADRFHGLVEEALRRIEAGHGADTLAMLAPGGHPVDLFRVTSVAGQPSIWLLGQKILG
jgi:transposase InsO family protein